MYFEPPAPNYSLFYFSHAHPPGEEKVNKKRRGQQLLITPSHAAHSQDSRRTLEPIPPARIYLLHVLAFALILRMGSKVFPGNLERGCKRPRERERERAQEK